MEKKIVVSKRFRKNTFKVYGYLIKEYSAKTAFSFLEKLQQRVELIIQYPEIGKLSQKKPNVRSVTLQPHNRIYYRLNKNSIQLLSLFDMRKKKLPLIEILLVAVLYSVFLTGSTALLLL